MVLRGIPGLKAPLPMIPGADFAGDIVEVGLPCPGSDSASEGSLPRRGRGQGRDWRQTGVSGLSALPIPAATVSYSVAAGATAYGTALRMIAVRGTVWAGEVMLVMLSASGSGTLAIQLRKKYAGDDRDSRAHRERRSARSTSVADVRSIDTSTQDFVRGEVPQTVWQTADLRWRQHRRRRQLYRRRRYLGQRDRRFSSALGGMLTCGATSGYDARKRSIHLVTCEHSIIGSDAWSRSNPLLKMVEAGDLAPIIDRKVRSAGEFTETYGRVNHDDAARLREP